MKRILPLLLPFLGGIATDRALIERPARAQTSPNAPSISIGNSTITVGMAREAALAALSGYSIGMLNGGDRAMVTTKPVLVNGVNQLRVLGDVTFEGGVVKEVTRHWDRQSGDEVQKLWKALWGAASNVVPDNVRYMSVGIRAYSTNSPQRRSQTIDIRVASRVLTLEWSEIDTTGIVLSTHPPTLSDVSVGETVF